MMKVVGLTGGIGSGKTTAAKMFEDLGIPLYIADDRAKALMHSSQDIRKALQLLFGDKAYQDGKLNRPFIASKIFGDEKLLKQMNAIVHPVVALDFKQWLSEQTSNYVIKEAAIIFENQQQNQYDYIITVTAPVEERILRVIKRDDSSRDKVLSIMNNQWSDEDKIKHSDFVIVNQDIEDTKQQVLRIHNTLQTKL